MWIEMIDNMIYWAFWILIALFFGGMVIYVLIDIFMYPSLTSKIEEAKEWNRLIKIEIEEIRRDMMRSIEDWDKYNDDHVECVKRYLDEIKKEKEME